MVCENYESCGNFLYNFESYIDSNDGKFISRKYYCPSCYKEIDIDLANDEFLFAERQRQVVLTPTLVGGIKPLEIGEKNDWILYCLS